jgi:DNA polymerase III subunit beta
MKAILNASTFGAALKAAQSCAATAPNIPVLSHALLRTGESAITVLTTDLDKCLELKVEADIEIDGAVLLPAKRLAGILAGMDGDTRITAAAGSASAEITHSRSRFKLNAAALEDFPELPSIDGEIFTAELSPAGIKLLEAVGSAASQETTRYYLNGAYAHSANGLLNMVATDGTVLLLEKTAIAYAGPGVIIPAAAVELAGKLFGKTGATLRTNGSKVELASEKVRLVSKLIDGSFPDYARLIPSSHSADATVAATDFTAALKRLDAIGSDKKRSPGVVASWGADASQLHLALPQGESGDGEAVLEAQTDGNGTVGFSPTRAIDLIDALGVKDVRLTVAGPSDPILFFSPERIGMTALLMPMRV